MISGKHPHISVQLRAETMDRVLKYDDKESLKKAMLKHEEIFKHQVLELHRLYRVQKLLMMDMKLKKRIEGNKMISMLESDEDPELELTLTTGSSKRRRRRRNEERSSYSSESGASFASFSDESRRVKLSTVDAAGKFKEDDRMKHPPWLYQYFSHNLTS